MGSGRVQNNKPAATVTRRDVPSTKDLDRVSEADLEKLLVNNPSFERIRSFVNRFNPIRVMRMEDMEIRHSAILAWLLDPNETHGLDDRFLRSFLAEVQQGRSGNLSATHLLLADLRDVEVLCERDRVDIAIVHHEQGWAFVIENKVRSKVRPGQLKGYTDKITQAAKDRHRTIKCYPVQLTVDEDAPDEGLNIRYAKIADMLRMLVGLHGERVGAEVAQFIRHYLEVIDAYAGTSEEAQEMEGLARQIYIANKKAIDFIIEHGRRTALSDAADRFFESRKDLTPFSRNERQASFLPESWTTALSLAEEPSLWTGCERWWKSRSPLILFFHLVTFKDGREGNLWLHAEVGPISNHPTRTMLIEAIRNIPTINFRTNAAKDGAKFSKFLTENSIKINDCDDSDEIKRAMDDLWNKKKDCLESVGTVIPQLVNAVSPPGA